MTRSRGTGRGADDDEASPLQQHDRRLRIVSYKQSPHVMVSRHAAAMRVMMMGMAQHSACVCVE